MRIQLKPAHLLLALLAGATACGSYSSPNPPPSSPDSTGDSMPPPSGPY
jgi:hypothetical protein